jgi:hypothetical protein
LFDWLPDVCRELRGNLTDIYWLLLIPFAVFSICLEFFKLPDGSPAPGRVIKRVVVSMLLLYSFDQCMSAIAMISDGLTDKIGGIAKLKDLLDHMRESYQANEGGWLKFREAILYIMSLISYLIAYLGVFVADFLIHFVWAILYVVSPLMILMYVNEKTAFITTNLYRGLMNVVTWKLFWSILAVLLIKLATSPEAVKDSHNFVMVVLMNLCIGLSMLFVPSFTKSLLSNGLEGAASAFAAAPAAAALGAAKLYATKTGKGGLALGSDGIKGFPATRQWIKGKYDQTHAGIERGKNLMKKTHAGVSRAAQSVREFGVKDHPKTVRPPFTHKATSPLDPKGPFGSGKKKILNGEKE